MDDGLADGQGRVISIPSILSLLPPLAYENTRCSLERIVHVQTLASICTICYYYVQYMLTEGTQVNVVDG